MQQHPTVAIIPARRGSKRIPDKNLFRLGGRPLLAHTIVHAHTAARVDEIYVSTEDPTIAEVATSFSAQVIARPDELAADTVSSEAVLEHALGWLRDQGIVPDLVAFLQCTSPLRAREDIDRAIDTLRQRSADSLLSVCQTSRFLWGTRAKGEPYAINYDFQRRARTQDLPTQYQENGSIYLFKPWVLEKLGNRLGGRIAFYEMDYWHSFEIDTPEDLELCSWILQRSDRTRSRELPEQVELVVLDFDGVMTDDRVWITEDGREAVACSRSDGMGLALLADQHIRVAVLSAETNPIVAARCRKLDIPFRQGITDKAAALRALVSELDVDLSRVVYVGNDVNDLDCLRMARCGVATADAHPKVREVADRVLTRPGGRGAVRELCEVILSGGGRDG